MNSIRNDILQCLDEFSGNDDRLVKELGHLVARHGVKTCQVILHILTNLNMEPAEANNCWKQIVSHRRQLSDIIGREASLQTAICDYFSSVNKSLENPKVIEIKLFEETVKASRHDSLTGLLNRGSFDEELAKETSRAKRSNENFSIVFFDLDDFKKVNDYYGHQAGDTVLRNCAAIITKLKRAEDVVVRYGGEELVVLLPSTNKKKAMNFAERVRHEIEKMVVHHNKRLIRVTLSGGVASFPVDATDTEDLIRLADKAMYRAKSFGKNNITLYSDKNRRSARYDYHTGVEIKHLGFGSIQNLSATSKNISVDGLLFECSTDIEPGTTIEVIIQLNDDNRLLLIGDVAWVRQVANHKYDVGISFPRTNNSVKKAITDHILKPQEENSSFASLALH